MNKSTLVGNGVVQLAEIGGRELYDAAINIDDISADPCKGRKR